MYKCKVNIKDVIINAEMNVDEDVDVDDKYIFVKSYGGFEGVWLAKRLR
ncbi:MAG: hypothetical protein LBU10_02525 [Endomicrobium sp.]|jgi:hypothetical protein|nr:hypothetical protein [Endomicrobium sp.]